MPAGPGHAIVGLDVVTLSAAVVVMVAISADTLGVKWGNLSHFESSRLIRLLQYTSSCLESTRSYLSV